MQDIEIFQVLVSVLLLVLIALRVVSILILSCLKQILHSCSMKLSYISEWMQVTGWWYIQLFFCTLTEFCVCIGTFFSFRIKAVLISPVLKEHERSSNICRNLSRHEDSSKHLMELLWIY